MSNTTTSPSPSRTEILTLESTNMTANVQTRTGSRYTVVTRPNVGVVVIHDDKGWAVRAGQGSKVRVIDGRMFVLGPNGTTVVQTTTITGIYIMSN